MKTFKRLVYLFVVFIAQLNNKVSMVSSLDQTSRQQIVRVTASSQSSEYAAVPGPAQLAVDGNKNQDYFAGKSCTHTDLQDNPWWKADLGFPHHIRKLTVWNRADCCGERLATLKVQTSYDNVNFYDVDELKEVATNGGVYTFTGQFSGRYIRLTLGKSTPEYLTICEIEIEGSLISTSLINLNNKSPSQSSEYAPVPGPANLAIDGNKTPNYFVGKSCTHTDLQVNPWWQVDLGSEHDITQVKVWNRGDCCSERLTSLKLQTSNDNVKFYDVDELSGNSVNVHEHSFERRFSGRYIRLTLSKSTADYLTLCEVEIFGRARQASDLISKGKSATQSSEYNPSPGRASNAVDGQSNQDYFASSCTHTELQVNPWWKVDLGSIHRIYAVKVWNRADCCGERLTSLKVQTSLNNLSFYDVDELKEAGTNGGVYTFSKTFVGRYVRLVLSKPTADYLTLCEVEVYGYPDE